MENFSNKNLISIVVAVAGALILGAVVFVNFDTSSIFTNFTRQKESNIQEENNIQNVLSSQEVAQKVINFVNENMLQQGMTASMIDTVEENGLYKIKLKVGEQEIDTYASKNGKLLFPQFIDLDINPLSPQEGPESRGEETIGNFLTSKDEICKENGKPIVYFFGSENCSHCKWEAPIIENAASRFEGNIIFHNNKGADVDMDVFSKYSTGGVPTLVIGCKYYRVGSGQRAGEEEETKILTALICKLTDGKPTNVCDKVQDLIDQI